MSTTQFRVVQYLSDLREQHLSMAFQAEMEAIRISKILDWDDDAEAAAAAAFPQLFSE